MSFLVPVALVGLGCNAKPAPQAPPQSAASVPADKPEESAAPTMQTVAQEFGIELTEIEEPEQFRGGGDRDAVSPLYPRGDVRLSDLDEFRVDVTSDFDGSGKISFRSQGKVLFEEAFEPDGFQTVANLPAEVRSALKAGTKVTWGFYPDKGQAVITDFTVVEEDSRLQSRMEEVERKFGDANSYPAAAMRAQLLLNKRLYLSAYREAQRSLTLGTEDATQAYAIMQASLRRMKLNKSELWTQIQDKVVGIKGRNPSVSRLR